MATVELDKVKANEMLQSDGRQDFNCLQQKKQVQVNFDGGADVQGALPSQVIGSIREGKDGRYLLVRQLEWCPIRGWQSSDGRRRTNVNMDELATLLGITSSPPELQRPGPHVLRDLPDEVIRVFQTQGFDKNRSRLVIWCSSPFNPGGSVICVICRAVPLVSLTECSKVWADARVGSDNVEIANDAKLELRVATARRSAISPCAKSMHEVCEFKEFWVRQSPEEEIDINPREPASSTSAERQTLRFCDFHDLSLRMIHEWDEGLKQDSQIKKNET